jgi:hemerythrin-like domain-containing protein
VLDECHRQTLGAIARIETIAERIEAGPPDAQTRALASAVIRHFSIVAREHHADEERHVFPKLAASGDPAMEQAVLRLQQDHHWLQEDWMTLLPHLDAIACGQSWYDVDVVREGGAIFAALSRDHIFFEECVLYPEFRRRLRPVEVGEIEREMAARRRASRGVAARGCAPVPHDAVGKGTEGGA